MTRRAYGELIRAQVSRASTGDKVDLNTGAYTEEGKADLRAAVESWVAYQAIDPKNTEEEASLASRVVQAYTGLEDLEGLVSAQEVVAVNRESVGTYAALAQYAYLAGQVRKGDLAAPEGDRARGSRPARLAEVRPRLLQGQALTQARDRQRRPSTPRPPRKPRTAARRQAGQARAKEK